MSSSRRGKKTNAAEQLNQSEIDSTAEMHGNMSEAPKKRKIAANEIVSADLSVDRDTGKEVNRSLEFTGAPSL